MDRSLRVKKNRSQGTSTFVQSVSASYIKANSR